MFTASDKYDYHTDSVGVPGGPSALVKLVNWEEGGYTVQRKWKNQNGSNRTDADACCGEIHLSSIRMTKGYFGMGKPDECFYTDGDGTHWFR